MKKNNKYEKKSIENIKINKVEKNFIDIDFIGHSLSMNDFISNSHSFYIKYKRLIHNIAKTQQTYFIKKQIIQTPIIIVTAFRKKNRILDYDNLVPGIKPIIDVLVKDFYIIKDDTINDIKTFYYQLPEDKDFKINIKILSKSIYFKEKYFILTDHNKIHLNLINYITTSNNEIKFKEYKITDEEFERFMFYNKEVFFKIKEFIINKNNILYVNKNQIFFKDSETLFLKDNITIEVEKIENFDFILIEEVIYNLKNIKDLNNFDLSLL